MRAVRLAFEERLPTLGRLGIKTPPGRRWYREIELVLPQRRQLGCHEIRCLVDIDPERRVGEVAVPMHLGHGDVGVPVRHRALRRVGLARDALEAEGGRDHDGTVDPIPVEFRVVLAGTPRVVDGFGARWDRG